MLHSKGQMVRSKSKLLVAATLLALRAIVSPAYSENYTITNLGTLGGNLSASAGINARGEATGVSSNSGGSDYAFLFNGTMMLNLGTFPGGDGSAGTGINARGEVTGSATTSAGLQHAFLFNGKTMIDLGVLPGSNEQFADSIGEAINARGEVAGTSSAGSSDDPHAFLYNGKTMLDLGTFGGTNSVGLGINNRGEVTGAALTTGNATYYAFLYNGKTKLSLGTLGGAYSVGEAINARGEVTGYSATNSPFEHAFLYNGKTMIDLGSLGTSSVGYGINDRGDVVGSTNIAGEGTAFLYENGAMLNLNTLIAPTDPLYGDVWLNEATGINDRGQIVADGYIDGKSSAFLLTPWGAVPETSTWIMTLIGFAGIGFAGYHRARGNAA